MGRHPWSRRGVTWRDDKATPELPFHAPVQSHGVAVIRGCAVQDAGIGPCHHTCGYRGDMEPSWRQPRRGSNCSTYARHGRSSTTSTTGATGHAMCSDPSTWHVLGSCGREGREQRWRCHNVQAVHARTAATVSALGSELKVARRQQSRHRTAVSLGVGLGGHRRGLQEHLAARYCQAEHARRQRDADAVAPAAQLMQHGACHQVWRHNRHGTWRRECGCAACPARRCNGWPPHQHDTAHCNEPHGHVRPLGWLPNAERAGGNTSIVAAVVHGCQVTGSVSATRLAVMTSATTTAVQASSGHQAA